MRYDELAAQNKLYFELLESLTLQISFCKERGLTDRIEFLNNKKNTVKVLININLDKIEDIWAYGYVKMRKAKRKAYRVVPEKQKQQLIKMFVDNPNQSIKQLAALNELSVDKTNKIISEYLINYKTPVNA